MKEQATKMAKTQDKKVSKPPFFVEAGKMLEKMEDITRETSQKAFEYFMNHGGTLGSRFDDWLHAEMDLLRPVPVEISQTKDLINIRAAVPGFKPDEIEISVKDNNLFLSGETDLENKKEDEQTFYTEWRSNRFYRQLNLPAEVLAESADANLKDGVLTLVLKKKPMTDPTQIPVKAA